MPRTPLENYLRFYRKRLGLSQDAVAYLMGSQSGSKVCRYERSARGFPLDAALAYEVILGAPVIQLFAGKSGRIRKAVIRRARQLQKTLALLPPTAPRSRALAALDAIITRS